MSIKTEYTSCLEEFHNIYDFLEKREIKSIEKLESLWRKQNIILRVRCSKGDYIFKIIKDPEEETEIQRIQIMKQVYPELIPDIYLVEQNSILMDYIRGESFFGLKESERVEKIDFAGESLKKSYFGKNGYPKKDISAKVLAGFERYRKTRARFFLNDELRLNKEHFDIFKDVSTQPSHNDLNALNLIYGREIKLIDPSDEGFEDISRDIGRYCASCFFNNYDHYGNNKKHSIEIAEAFLDHFDSHTLERAKYFIGESFLSFLNFDTVSVLKLSLKTLAMNLLLKKGKIISLLERSLE